MGSKKVRCERTVLKVKRRNEVFQGRNNKEKLVRTIILFMCCFFSSSVFAYWEFQHSTANATVYYYKKDDYKGFFGGVYFANLADMKTPELIGGEPYMSIWSKFELNCSKKQVRVLEIKYFSKNMKEGRLVTETSDKSGWFGASDKDLIRYCNKT